MKWAKPLPEVGDRVKMDWGPDHPGTWPCAGEVRAVVDECQIVVRHWLPRKRHHVYVLIDRLT